MFENFSLNTNLSSMIKSTIWTFNEKMRVSRLQNTELFEIKL